MIRNIVTTLAFTCAMSTAHAQYADGNKLLSDIESDSVVREMVALGYVMGVADTGWWILHCVPGRVQAGQVRDMVKNYLRANPEERHKAADILVTRVLNNTWPCPKRNPT